MGKLSFEEKVSLYNEVKEGKPKLYLSNKYNVQRTEIYYLVDLIDLHGFDILRYGDHHYSDETKERAILDYLNSSDSYRAVALQNGIRNPTSVSQWVKEYKKNGYNMVTKGKRDIMTIKKNSENKKKKLTDSYLEKENKLLEKEIAKLKATVDYQKKLLTVLNARKK